MTSGTDNAAGCRGEEVIASFAPVSIEGVEWGIVAEEAVSEVAAPMNALLRTMLMITTIAALIVVAAACFVASKILKPTSEASNAIKAISMGDLGVDFKHDTDDEIGDMATSHAEMKEH